jgi:hypothetical protein
MQIAFPDVPIPFLEPVLLVTTPACDWTTGFVWRISDMTVPVCSTTTGGGLLRIARTLATSKVFGRDKDLWRAVRTHRRDHLPRQRS